MSNILGIKLEGEIALGTFAEVMQRFHALVRTLTAEIAGRDVVAWQIAELSAGSAYAAVRGVAENEDEPERVVAAYGAVGQALEMGAIVPYTLAVGERANELVRVAADGAVEALRFFVAGEEVASIKPSTAERDLTEKPIVLGAVTGIVETLARRPSLQITVYDDLFDHAVKCQLSADQYEMARNVWGKRVVVSGRVVRDAETGRVTAVNDVLSVKVVDAVTVGDVHQARGVLPWRTGDDPAEVSIRRLRDA